MSTCGKVEVNFGTWWRWVVSLTPRPLFLQGTPRYSLDRRLGELHCRFGRSEKSLRPCRETNSDRPVRSPVTVLIVSVVAVKFPEWFYCKPHTCILTAYWEGSQLKYSPWAAMYLTQRDFHCLKNF